MAKQAKAQDNTTRWIVIAMVLLVVVTGVVFSLMSQSNKENASLAALDGTKLKAAVTATIDPANGSAIVLNPGQAKVIDVWEDPQCPICKNFEDANGDYIESLVRDNKATVRFHVLSFLGDESVRAANASFCAADEGQYLDFHHALYAVQSPLENSGFWSNEKLIAIGKKIGISSTKFSNCVTKGSKIALVKANYDSMEKFGVKGTPTVFINGKLWERKSPDFNLAEFKAAVEAA
ncbi:MAG: thioredoxin domain-containing protein [Acidobacteriota bacterium]|jgi:protein-disulfide isomerase|nr:thioredoxin domain-containing protein [Acidobacteriota bacterium]